MYLDCISASVFRGCVTASFLKECVLLICYRRRERGVRLHGRGRRGARARATVPAARGARRGPRGATQTARETLSLSLSDPVCVTLPTATHTHNIYSFVSRFEEYKSWYANCDEHMVRVAETW